LLHTKEELGKLQALSLDLKIELAEARILEFYHKMGGKVYISFSGGKDSTVLLHLVRSILPETRAVFCDTGLEFPELKEFVKTFDNITIIRPEISFRQVIDRYGYPLISKEVSEAVARKRNNPSSTATDKKFVLYKDGRRKFSYARWKFLIDAPFKVSGRCCYHLKKKPLMKFKQESGLYPIIGVTCAESGIREMQWLVSGCNSFTPGNEKSRPLSVWTEVDIWEYIERFKLPIASVYTHGRTRTGCIYCAFGAHLEKNPNRFQTLERSHPQLHEYCMKPVAKGGLGMAEVLDYVGIPYKSDKTLVKRVLVHDADRDEKNKEDTNCEPEDI
jgi:3'-phosphoadenosine 5'-phosphosulfate sulfotransferase (PAPS reductase)/FAD synthetase